MKRILLPLLFPLIATAQMAITPAPPGAPQSAVPLACQVSEWSEWQDDTTGSCSAGMHMGSQTRYRTVIRAPGRGGAACPALSEQREVHKSCGGALPTFALPSPGTTAYAALRVRDTNETVKKRPGEYGQFRIPCAYSHMAYDDPIVFPGSPGASHLHVFFGNTSADAGSTEQSLGAGSSTCRGGTANRSSYWVPAVIDTGLNATVVPDSNLVYYKDGGLLPSVTPINAPPNGLRMIAGNPVTFDRESGNARHNFECWSDKLPGGRSGKMQRIPSGCPVGGHILFELGFPQCWDGVNLDSPNHRSHMAFAGGSPRRCPATHPVALATIAFNIRLPVREGNDTGKWRLSSDAYPASKPGGYSAHGDVWVHWDEEVKNAWLDGCIRSGADCHAHMLGDNRMLY